MAEVSAAEQQAFFTRMLPYAQKASNLIKQAKGHTIPVSDILAEWANESAYGTSNLAVYARNFGGIKHVDKVSIDTWPTTGGYAGYSTIDQFAKDYARVWSLDYYKAARDVPDTDVVQTAVEMGKSPYAESHYARNGHPGQGLIDIIKASDLTRFDGLPAVQAVADLNQQQTISYAAAMAVIVALVAGLSSN